MYTDQFDQPLVLRDGQQAFVRGLRGDDAPLLARFFAGLSSESRVHFRPHTFTPEGAAEVVRTAAGPDGIYFLVMVGDEPAGYGFLWHLNWSSSTLGIAVADTWQNQGIGSLLMRFLVSVAEQMGKEGVNLTVDDDNPRAIHVYEQTGFQLVRKIREMHLPLRALDGPAEKRG